ncbi:uncharacterized protein LOC106651881 [Trichogramma pretiosum]|uniref:uncharacterized protein LOC106651881 n=1 Tax=Trichogramma pretiosum TaxID=7493 RepID=UPI0006C992F3|nr:uncharacterized protein LOC106651881 [Trichogramma pretiosum]
MFAFPKCSIIKGTKPNPNLSIKHSAEKDKNDAQNLSSVMANLKLDAAAASSSYRVAGEIWRRIELIDCVSVRACPGVTLAEDTKIYMKTESKELAEIGTISEIYGHINEPLYEVLVPEGVSWDLLRSSNVVYYDPEHPCTRFARISC